MIKKLLGLRPTDTSAAAIMAAQERAHALHAEALERVAATRKQRDALLVDSLDQSPQQGSDEPVADTDQTPLMLDLQKAEQAMQDAVADVDRISAMLAALESKLDAAKRAEAFGVVMEARAAYEAAHQKQVVWWEKNARKLRALIAEGVQLAQEQEAAISYFRQRQRSAPENLPEAREVRPDTDRESNVHTWRERAGFWLQGLGLDGEIELKRKLPGNSSETTPSEVPVINKTYGGLSVDYQDASRGR
jgi:hypothetical protein